MSKVWRRLGILVLIAAILVLIIVNSLNHVKKADVPAISKLYDATKSIELAKRKLITTNGQALVISDVETSQKVISLNFKGLSDNNTNEEVLDLLKDYEIKVDFFLPGILAAEELNLVRRIREEGHKIGSNSLTGALNMDKYDTGELIEDFSKANTILSTISGDISSTLMLNSTTLNDNVLKAAYACGNEKVIDSTYFINYQSFKNYDEALGYVKRMKKGATLTIKMDGVLEEDEYEAPVKVVNPTVDKKPGVKSYEELPENREITQIVEWILQALKETGYKTVFAENLSLYEDIDIVNKSIDISQDATIKLPQESIPSYPWNSSTRKLEGDKANKEDKVNRDEKIKQLRFMNNGKKAEQFHTVYTTEQALSYTFYGISRIDVLEDVLNKLDILDSKGTFYVTEKDVKTYGEQIKRISDSGHEIGICLSELTGTDYYSVIYSILSIKEGVMRICGQNPVLVRYAYDLDMTDEALEAVSSLGCTVVWQDLSIASSNLGKDTTFNELMNYVFNAGNISVKRGYVIYYRMDYYEDHSLVGNAMITIARDRIDNVAYDDGLVDNDSSYELKTLGSVLGSDKVFNYPLKPDQILASVKDVIHDGYLIGLDEYEKFELFKRNYIGNPSLTSEKSLPGFSHEEITQLNNVGRFTNDKTLFLTFDDWGSDKAVNKILYVLRKYDVKASFYVRTNYMQNNPNLLRAIAEEGHDVGSHTDMHLVYATSESIEKEDDTYAIYYSLTPEEIVERKKDLWTSYNKLQYTIGDIQVNGRPALTTIFRPPTLAISKSGMEAIFDMGFTHILSGDFSTNDYEETDYIVLANKILNGISNGLGTMTLENGSVLVMHMSDNNILATAKSSVTAEALDIIIPKLIAEGYRFEKVSNYLVHSR